MPCVQSWPKKLVLGCVISPLRQQEESRNLGQPFLATLYLGRLGRIYGRVTNALRFGNCDALFVDLTKYLDEISFDPGENNLISDEATMRPYFIVIKLTQLFSLNFS